MTDADRLQIAEGRYDRDDHLFKLILFPILATTFAFSEEVLQVCTTVHVLTDHGDTESVVHSLVEVVPEKLQHIRVTLHLEQLHCFFLYTAAKSS